jgi:two-component system phosphate regulon sensor histidine kinase PhoR
MTPFAEVAAFAVAVGGGVAIGHLMQRRNGSRQPEQAERVEVRVDPRFEQLVRALRVGILTLDERSRITALNATAASIFGISEKNALGRSLIEAIPSFELDQRVRAAIEGQSSRRELLLDRPGGERSLTVAALAAGDGEGAIVVATDETRLRELEQMRRDFVSNVSHELRTPLSSINLMLETILSTNFDDEALHLFLPRVKEEVDRMTQMVAGLLDLARVETGHIQLRREEFDLADLAHRTVATFQPRAERLGIALRFEGEKTAMRGDPDRLTQVVVNLVDNALRNTPAGGNVEIAVQRRNGAALLEVGDTGTGIPYADLPHVFERFYVVDRSRARESSGTGLGLSIVKHIVEAHGGTASVESEFGFGSKFTCAFPA